MDRAAGLSPPYSQCRNARITGMAFVHFSDEEGELTYRERLSPWARMFVAVIGVAMFVIPVVFLQSPAWNTSAINLLAVVQECCCPCSPASSSSPLPRWA